MTFAVSILQCVYNLFLGLEVVETGKKNLL
jgi:hypothetical protein